MCQQAKAAIDVEAKAKASANHDDTKWSCSQCTFENSKTDSRCQMCEHVKADDDEKVNDGIHPCTHVACNDLQRSPTWSLIPYCRPTEGTNPNWRNIGPFSVQARVEQMLAHEDTLAPTGGHLLLIGFNSSSKMCVLSEHVLQKTEDLKEVNAECVLMRLNANGHAVPGLYVVYEGRLESDGGVVTLCYRTTDGVEGRVAVPDNALRSGGWTAMEIGIGEGNGHMYWDHTTNSIIVNGHNRGQKKIGHKIYTNIGTVIGTSWQHGVPVGLPPLVVGRNLMHNILELSIGVNGTRIQTHLAFVIITPFGRHEDKGGRGGYVFPY